MAMEWGLVMSRVLGDPWKGIYLVTEKGIQRVGRVVGGGLVGLGTGLQVV